MPVAYSYVRFSSAQQRLGASLARQLELARHYAHTHDLVLDEHSYKDMGISAFRSKNAVEGGLRAFIEAVEKGHVAKGSYLLIESLDRLSRDTVDVAVVHFMNLVSKGIVIVTLNTGDVYSTATLQENQGRLFMALGEMIRANNESATKSKRAHDAIKRRIARGELQMTRLPSWLRMSADRKSAVVIPAKAAIVRRIFDLAIKGYGGRPIARKLFEAGTPVLDDATEWRQSTISQLLKNPAAYGAFRPRIGRGTGTKYGDVQEDVFPAVVPKETWLRAQSIVKDRTNNKRAVSGRNPNNIFAGISRCAHCGRAIKFYPRRGHHFLRCVGAGDLKVCDGRIFPFTTAEAALVHELSHRGQHAVGASFFTEQGHKRDALRAQITELTEEQQKLLFEGLYALARTSFNGWSWRDCCRGFF